ncbi:hypothetical protein T484DRAFT_1883230, partial [Baffinella frigidus]
RQFCERGSRGSSSTPLSKSSRSRASSPGCFPPSNRTTATRWFCGASSVRSNPRLRSCSSRVPRPPLSRCRTSTGSSTSHARSTPRTSTPSSPTTPSRPPPTSSPPTTSPPATSPPTTSPSATSSPPTTSPSPPATTSATPRATPPPTPRSTPRG